MSCWAVMMLPDKYGTPAGNIVLRSLLVLLCLLQSAIPCSAARAKLSSDNGKVVENHAFPYKRVRTNGPKQRGGEGIGSKVEQHLAVKLQSDDQEPYVVVDNGIIRVTFSIPDGHITGVRYKGIDNVLEVLNKENDRGYWDLVWAEPGSRGTGGTTESVRSTAFKVIVDTEDQVELSFTRPWDTSLQGSIVPLSIEKRYVVLRGSAGLYSYAIYEHSKEWPAFNLPRTRLAFKLRKDRFHYMAVADNRQRYMPLPDDRLPNRSRALAYPEAVLLVDPVEPEFKGEVDDKYQYSCAQKDLSVHGWIDPVESVGFWQIIPSNEFRSAGPLREELGSHVGPTTLAVFHSPHNVGEDLVMKFGPGEAWKKVYGPVFTYLNSGSNGTDQIHQLWEDAKRQRTVEVNRWPYDFLTSADFLKSDQRGTVHGRLLIKDRYISNENITGNGSYVGLAPPGKAGSWQKDAKGYQFWTVADDQGFFNINSIISGNYSLFAWVPGFVGEYRNDVVVTVTPGSNVDVGDLIYEPPRDGPTLWEIGFPDRSAAEFYIPDPNPKYINRLYVNHPDRYKQYGLWERYADLYPRGDLVYTVGSSDYKKDWFFAHVTRKLDNNTFGGTTWKIYFELENVTQSATYNLRLALASSNNAELQVRINEANVNPPLFTSRQIGKDNAIARHGVRGIYYLFNVPVSGKQLVGGNNTIFLTQAASTGPFQGLMYDYIRLEGPPRS